LVPRPASKRRGTRASFQQLHHEVLNDAERAAHDEEEDQPGDEPLESAHRSPPFAHHGTQSATKTFVSPGFPLWRLLQTASRRPAGENIGKPSNVGLKARRSRAVPAAFTAQRSKSRPRGSARFDSQ